MRADLAGLKCVCDEIARAIQGAESSVIFLLVGDIGAGKTTLVREFAKRIGITDSVTSPTFSLLHIYSNSACGDFLGSASARFLDRPSVLSASLTSHNPKNSSTILEFDSCKIAESSTDSANPQNLVKNNSVRSTQTRPIRGAKNRIQTSSSASADFLLESDKRGSPPKSEKRQLLGTHLNNSRGEREQGGAALLRKETRKLNSQKSDDFAESNLDSVDSAISTQEANSTIADEFLGFCEASDKDKTKVYRGSEPKQSLKSRCESKFATTIYHYDLFNRNLSELLDLGLLDLLEQRGIHFVEWGDRRLFEIIKDAFENIFILQITKAKKDRIYKLKREF